MSHFSKTYLVSIAVSNYKYLNKLPNAVPDTAAIHHVLVHNYCIEKHWSLQNNEVNEQNIKKVFAELSQLLTQEDTLLLFYNGYGTIDKQNETTYWQFSESRVNQSETWYNCAHLFADIAQLSVKHVALLINSCFSGHLLSPSFKENKGQGQSRILFAASRKEQPVGVKNDPIKENNPFVGAMLKLLKENKELYELPLINIINYTIIQFMNEDDSSVPHYGSFQGDEGGSPVLHLKEGEQVWWDKALQQNNIPTYEQFLEKFPNGIYKEKATEKLNKLYAERRGFATLLKQILERIKEFESETSPIVSQDAVSYIEIIKSKTDHLYIKVEEYVADDDEWLNVRKHNNFNGKTLKEKQIAFRYFLETYSNNRYVAQAKNRLQKINENLKEKELWNTMPNTETIAENRRVQYATYLRTYRYGQYVKKAGEKYRDIDLYLGIQKTIKNEQFQKAKELLRRYQQEFPNGDYIKKTKGKLVEIDTIARAKNIKADFELFKKENNLYQFYDLVERINGFMPQEQKANQKIYTEALKIITDYEERRKTAFDQAIQSEDIRNMQLFIDHYKDDELAEDVVTKMKDALDDKDDELFDQAERSKNLNDFEEYLYQFGEDGIYSNDIKECIVELQYYYAFDNKMHYHNYLNEYPNGLMKEEAKKCIRRAIQAEEKEERYAQALQEDDIIIYQKYLEDYETQGEQEEKYQTIQHKYQQLFKQQQDRQIFEAIQETEGKAKLHLCNEYIQECKDGLHIAEVIKIKEETQLEVARNQAFDHAKEQMTIVSLENYKKQFSKHHDEVDDHIAYVEAKKGQTVEAFQQYLEQYEEEGLNTQKAKDGITFLTALSLNTIPSLENYLYASVEKEFEQEAAEQIYILKNRQQAKTAFEDVKARHTIVACSEYLSLYKGVNKDYDEYVLEELEQLKLAQQDDEDFETAKEFNSIDSFSKYLGQYGAKGQHHIAATRLLLDRQLGVTDKDVDVLEKMEGNTKLIARLTTNMGENTHSIKQLVGKMDGNAQAIADLGSQINQLSTTVSETVQSKIKNGQISKYIIIFVVFLVVIWLSFFILFFRMT